MMKNLLPIYYQIKETIRNRILNKEYLPGQRIPAIVKLAEEFKVNHLTVREAIRHLEQEGFLFSKRGSGTFVSDDKTLRESLCVEITGFMDELFYQVQKAKTKTAEINIIQAPKMIAEKLNLEENEREIVKIDRVRLLDGHYFNYITNYLPKKIGAKITKDDLLKKPLLQILEQDLKLKFSEAFQFIQAVFANQVVAEKLKIPAGTPTLYIERILYGQNNKPIQLFSAHYRGDLFKYIARFKNIRRKNTNVWIHEENMTP